MDRIKADERFSQVLTNPRFRNIPKRERKVKIDKRFQSIFSDSRFKLKYSVDKRGRPINRNTSEDLKKYYELTSESGEDDDAAEVKVISCQSSFNSAVTQGESESATGKNQSSNKDTISTTELDPEATCSGKNLPLTRKSSGRAKGETVTLGIRSKCTKKEKKSKIDSEPKNYVDDNFPPAKIADKKLHQQVTTLELDLSSGNESDSGSDDEQVDLARGEGNLETSDSDDGSSSDSESEEEVSHPWGEMHGSASPEEAAGPLSTRRLGIKNLDWDRITAQDLFVLLNSFTPPTGIIHSVKIYVSEYGKQRLEEEELKGPKELVEELLSSDEDDNTDDVRGQKYNMEKLRHYQLNRLRYYYAIVDCDSVETAMKLYDECDGVEYESSGTRFAISYVPDDMTFDEEPKSSAEKLPEFSQYDPPKFITKALQQAKVDLTWDEDDLLRSKMIQKAFTARDDEATDLSVYLAPNSSSDEDDPERSRGVNDGVVKASRINIFRQLLQDIDQEEHEKKDRGVELVVTWEPGLKETTEKIVKKKQNDLQQLTVWEQYQLKVRDKKQKKREVKLKAKEEEYNQITMGEEENPYSDDEIPADVDLNDPYFKEELDANFKNTKKQLKVKKPQQEEETEDEKKKKAELELLMMEADDGKQHFDMKAILKSEEKDRKNKKKRNSVTQKVEDSFQVDVKDPRFEALYTSHFYHLDPTNPQFKKTRAMEEIVKEKQRRREEGSDLPPTKRAKTIKTVDSSTKDSELLQLIQSVKNKTGKFTQKKKTR